MEGRCPPAHEPPKPGVRPSRDEGGNRESGEHRAEEDHRSFSTYRAMRCVVTNAKDQPMTLEWRAFNDGVAFRYVVSLPEPRRKVFMDEHTGLRLRPDLRGQQKQHQHTVLRIFCLWHSSFL